MEDRQGEGAQGLEGLGRGGHRDRLVRGHARRSGATDFLGYDTETAEGEVRAIVKDGKEAASLKAGDEGALVLNQTPFYGESGGQVGDQGVIKGPKGALFRVTDTQKKLGDVLVHIGRVEKGTFKPGDAVELVVDPARRTATRANHSATHLLHEALRQVLGTHVAQKGSLVAPERLRFDFSHTKPMSARRDRRGRGDGQRLRAAEHGRRDPPDGHRRRHGDRRHGAVRREVRRGGARRVDGGV